jgi:hypothetical protein
MMTVEVNVEIFNVHKFKTALSGALTMNPDRLIILSFLFTITVSLFAHAFAFIIVQGNDIEVVFYIEESMEGRSSNDIIEELFYLIEQEPETLEAYNLTVTSFMKQYLVTNGSSMTRKSSRGLLLIKFHFIQDGDISEEEELARRSQNTYIFELALFLVALLSIVILVTVAISNYIVRKRAIGKESEALKSDFVHLNEIELNDLEDSRNLGDSFIIKKS